MSKRIKIMLSPKSVLITGSNRGVGLELVKHFLKLPTPPSHVFAACRSPDSAHDLKALAASYPSLVIVQLEATDQASIDAARVLVEEKLGGAGLNLLINNAGIMKVAGFKDVNADSMMEHYNVNCIGPLMVAKAFYSLIKSAAEANSKQPMSCSRAAIINISTSMASIAENTSGGNYPYRASKAALNMVTTNLANDLKADGILATAVHPGWAALNMVTTNLANDLKADGILATAVHPGWVRTDLGGPSAQLSSDESATGIVNVLAKLQGEEGTGRFYHAKGHLMAW